MTSNAYDIVYVAVTGSAPPVTVMQFITKAWNSDSGEIEFEREATDEAIAAEIAKAGLEMVSWRRMDGPEEIPETRDYRQAWEDDGKTIVVNPVRAKAIDIANAATAAKAARDPFAEIDALRAKLAAVKAGAG